MNQPASGSRPASAERPPAFAAGLVGFAGVLLIVLGIFQALQGLAAILKDDLLVLTRDYVYDWTLRLGAGFTC